MAKKPDFKDKSWDTTWWSLWGLLYRGADSDRALQTAISQRFGETRARLNRLGPQVEPLKSKVQEWRDELDSFARTITFGEADAILGRLNELHEEIGQQLERDRELARTGKKLAPSGKPNLRMPTPSESESAAGPSDDDVAFAARYSSAMGHSAATAKSPPKPVRSKQAYVPPTPEEIWKAEQRDMANRCDSSIGFGAHDVVQDSVLRHLGLEAGETVSQYRSGPENSHERIMVTSRNRQFWTLGLTHRERRDLGRFSVYRRDGAKNRFVYTAGLRHPKDPGP